MKRQIKHYRVFLGVVDKVADNPTFGSVDVVATDALAAALQVNANLGKRQYVSAVGKLPTPAPAEVISPVANTDVVAVTLVDDAVTA